MPIQIASRRRAPNNIVKDLGPCHIIDVTSKATDDFVQFSPFFPHGGIPIPFGEGQLAQSVEGIWQGLKVFEQHGVDPSKFENSKMKGLKRTVRKYGRVLGHQKGLHSDELLDYYQARIQIYLPAYEWVLQNKCADLIQQIASLAEKELVILLDYETNEDLENLKKPLSHAGLVKVFVEEGKLI